jgi:cation diffusion facilitator family transporter
VKWQFDKYLILESEQRQKRHALKLVIGAGILIAIIKVIAFYFTHSTAILSDSLESVINLAAGLFALWSLYYASRPRDSKHPYGHGKIEFLAASGEGVLIFALGASIVAKAIYNLYNPHYVHNLDTGLVLIAITAIVNIFLSRFLHRQAKKFDSVILETDSKRVLTDGYTSVALVGGLLVIYFTGMVWIDSFLALFSGVFVIRTGYKLIKQSVKGLLDAADTHVLQDVVSVLQDGSRPEWIDIKNMRTSHHGMYLYVDCHLTLPWYWSLQKVSEEVREAELLINQKFKQRVELFVQAEPCKPRHCSECMMADCAMRQQPNKRQQKLNLRETSSDNLPVVDAA